MSATLHRPLLSGLFFNALFPLPDGKKVNLGAGDTNTSIELIIQWALKHHHEVEKVAPLFLENELEKTCFNIHHFLFNHFQYKADDSAQLLRSPAYAWKERKSGIDCKSYSIIASCILLQLGVKHYIRKIKQPSFNPDAYTHVYVIVPSNQNTGSLKNGYFTIDGTLPTTLEPNYIATKDFFMDKLKHYGLNGLASSPDSPDNPYNENTQDGGEGKIDWAELIKKVNWNKFTDIFNAPIDCWGGSAFADSIAKPTSEQIILYLTQITEDINIAASKGDYLAISELDVELHQAVFAGICGYEKKWSEVNWNSCTVNGLKRVLNILYYFREVVLPAYKGWSENYFTKQKIADRKYNNHLVEAPPAGFYFAYTGTPCEVIIPQYNYQIKSLVQQLKAFEFTPYLQEVGSNKNHDTGIWYEKVDINKYLNGLSTVIRVFGSNTSNGNDVIDVYDDENPDKKNTSKAGSYIMGTLALAMILGYAFNKTKDVKQVKN